MNRLVFDGMLVPKKATRATAQTVPAITIEVDVFILNIIINPVYPQIFIK